MPSDFTTLIERDYEIDAGHRLVGHESKCARLHGHRYRFVLRVGTNLPLDAVGRVLDFSGCKELLAHVVEPWDHRMLLNREDPLARAVHQDAVDADEIVLLGFNPTAENMAHHVCAEVSRYLLPGFWAQVDVHETPNCRARSRWVEGNQP